MLAGEAELLEVLADAGADIEEEAADGATALFAACHAGNQEVVQALLDLGSNPEKISVSTMPHVIMISLSPSLSRCTERRMGHDVSPETRLPLLVRLHLGGTGDM